MQQRWIVATVAVLAIAGGCAGCGSSALTSAELTKQVNAICKERTAQMVALRKRHTRDFRGLVVAGVPVYAKSVDKLRGLDAPSSAKVPYGRFVAIQKIQVAQLQRAAAGKPAEASAAEHARMQELERLTHQLNLAACQ